MSLGAANKELTRRATALIVGALVVSSLLYIPLQLGPNGRVLSLSFFDLVIIGLAGWLVLTARIQKSPLVYLSAALVLSIPLYAWVVFAIAGPIDATGLIRETIKYLGFVVGVAVCSLTIANTRLEAIPRGLIAGLALMILLAWLLGATWSLATQKLPLIVNGYSNIAIAFGVLALHLLDTNISRRVWFGLIAYQVSVLALAVWLGAFAMSAAAYFILLFTVFAASRRQADDALVYRSAFAVLVLLGLAGVIAFLASGVLGRLETIHVKGGIAVRLGLWFTALQSLPDYLPLGMGPGQFGNQGFTESKLVYALPEDIVNWFGFGHALGVQTRAFGEVPIHYFHNTFFAMIVEWGVLGVVLSLLLLCAIWKTFRALSPLAAVAYVAYVVPTLLLNDGLGFRMHYLLLGIGLGAWLKAGLNARVSAH